MKKIIIGENFISCKEAEIKNKEELQNYLLEHNHKEYVWVRYYDNERCYQRYTVRCWYNDGKTWEESQLENADKVAQFLADDGFEAFGKAEEPDKYGNIEKTLINLGFNFALVTSMTDNELDRAVAYDDVDDLEEFMDYMARKYDI